MRQVKMELFKNAKYRSVTGADPYRIPPIHGNRSETGQGDFGKLKSKTFLGEHALRHLQKRLRCFGNRSLFILDPPAYMSNTPT